MGDRAGAEPPGGGPGEGGRRRPARALLVAEEPDVRLVLGVMLADELGADLALVTAGTGARAVELLDAGPPPEVALVGLDLPDGSGVEVVRCVRAGGGLGLVVVFSAHGLVDADGIQAALDAGADVVVPEPDVTRLRAVLRRAPILTGRRLQ